MRVRTLPISTRLSVSVQVPVLTLPPKEAGVLAKPLTVIAVMKNGPGAGSAGGAKKKVCPGGPALSVKSWLPLNAGPEKSGWEMVVAPVGALELMVITPACADVTATIAASPNPNIARSLLIFVPFHASARY